MRAQPPATALSLSDQLARHSAALRFEALPAEVVQAVCLSVLDTLAVAWAGLDASGVPAVRALAQEQGGRADSRLWASPTRLPASEAAFANGVAAAALDFDALHTGGTVHADIVALPALLAVAERQQASGRDFVTAYAIAQDLIARLGLAAPGHSGWFYTSVHGVFGAAAGAARLLGLPAEGIRHAIGLALPQAGGTQQPMLEKSQTKRLQSAFAARAAVHAALLAERGLQGPVQALDGRFGAFALYEAADAAQVLEGLGERWENTGVGFKKYPNCGCAHAPLEAALQLVHAHRIAADQVQAVRVVLTPYAHRLVGAPYAPDAPDAQPEVSAQFSVQYAIATALLRGRFTLDDIAPAQALAPEALALAQRVVVEIDATQTGRMGPATVEIATATGRHSATVLHMPGDAAQPLTEQEVIAKARDAFARGPQPLSDEAAERLIGRVLEIDALAQIGTLWD